MGSERISKKPNEITKTSLATREQMGTRLHGWVVLLLLVPLVSPSKGWVLIWVNPLSLSIQGSTAPSFTESVLSRASSDMFGLWSKVLAQTTTSRLTMLTNIIWRSKAEVPVWGGIQPVGALRSTGWNSDVRSGHLVRFCRPTPFEV